VNDAAAFVFHSGNQQAVARTGAQIQRRVQPKNGCSAGLVKAPGELPVAAHPRPARPK